MRAWTGLLAGLLWMGCSGFHPMQAQSAPSGFPMAPDAPMGPLPGPIRMQRPPRAQRNALNVDRQKKIVTDTERLLALALDVKATLRTVGEGPMPSDLTKKVEEIEKLAHAIRQKEAE